MLQHAYSKHLSSLRPPMDSPLPLSPSRPRALETQNITHLVGLRCPPPGSSSIPAPCSLSLRVPLRHCVSPLPLLMLTPCSQPAPPPSQSAPLTFPLAPWPPPDPSLFLATSLSLMTAGVGDYTVFEFVKFGLPVQVNGSANPQMYPGFSHFGTQSSKLYPEKPVTFGPPAHVTCQLPATSSGICTFHACLC